MKYLVVVLSLFLMVGIASAGTLIVNTYHDKELIRSAAGDFATIRAGAGTDVNAGTEGYSELRSSATGTTYARLTRMVDNFALTSLNSSCTINSAIVSYDVHLQNNGLGSLSSGITNGTPTNMAAMAAADYNKFVDVRLSTDKTYAQFAPGWRNFTLNSDGLAYLTANRGSNVSIWLRLSPDINNSVVGITYVNGTKQSYPRIYMLSYGSLIPYLTVDYTYSAGGSAPVSSFTLAKPLYRIPGILQANDTSTNTPTQWNWSWGDGTWTNGTTQNATHKYTTRGTKSVLLVTSNAGGSNTTPTATTVRIVGYENNW
jgi:hypothetical protein